MLSVNKSCKIRSLCFVGDHQNISDWLAIEVKNERGHLSLQTVVLFGFKQIVCGNITELLLNSSPGVKRRTPLLKINEIYAVIILKAVQGSVHRHRSY